MHAVVSLMYLVGHLVDVPSLLPFECVRRCCKKCRRTGETGCWRLWCVLLMQLPRALMCSHSLVKEYRMRCDLVFWIVLTYFYRKSWNSFADTSSVLLVGSADLRHVLRTVAACTGSTSKQIHVSCLLQCTYALGVCRSPCSCSVCVYVCVTSIKLAILDYRVKNMLSRTALHKCTFFAGCKHNVTLFSICVFSPVCWTYSEGCSDKLDTQHVDRCANKWLNPSHTDTTSS